MASRTYNTSHTKLNMNVQVSTEIKPKFIAKWNGRGFDFPIVKSIRAPVQKT